MKKLKLYYSSLIIMSIAILCLSSCEKNKIAVPKIQVPLQVMKKDISSDYFSPFKYVKLEINDDCILGNIKKIILDGNKLYILDTKAVKAVCVFDTNGKFLNKIGTIGKGPGEYQTPIDFYIDKKNGAVIILDLFLKKTISYDFTGKYLMQNNLPFNCISIEKFEKHYLLKAATSGGIETAKKRYKFQNWDEKQITNKFLAIPKNQQGDFSLSNPLIRFGNKITYSEAFNDTIYRFADGVYNSKIYVDFGIKKLPEKISNLSLADKIQAVSSKTLDYRLFINNNFETNRFIYFTFLSKEGKSNCIHDLVKNKTYIFNQLITFNNKPIETTITGTADNNTVYTIIDPSSEIAKEFKIGNLDNPGLLLFKVK
ncbi:6-bladed beta-propeller [Flavobacterium daejeonense]|uniref:6-bladed beta-propeller n=1 Tax=Flavobacterium daejeonense TaxID=350893 RepID=UPI000B1ECB72|nr:6-bladed beta-propeller [Flavobacterium daejeonense]